MIRTYKTVDVDELRRMGRDVMEFHVDLKQANQEPNSDRILDGDASTGEVDRMGDIVEPDAFKRTSKKFLKNNPALLMHHGNDPLYGNDVYGTILEGEVHEKGYRVKALYGTGTNPLDPMEMGWNRIQQRFLRALSIGFRILRREDILDNGMVVGWRILELDLLEISVVSIPANAGALFNIGKAVKHGTDLDYDLYGRGLWGIPSPFQNPKRAQHRFDPELLARIESANHGLEMAANSGGV